MVRKWFTHIINKDFNDAVERYPLKNGSLMERYNIALDAKIYVWIMVDIHTIGRMFKKFTYREKYTGELFADTAKNIIIYTGSWHTEMTVGFLTHYGFNMKMISDSDPLNDECVKIDDNFMNDLRPLLHLH